MSRILVTGASGFIGFEVVEKLLSCGHKVIGLDNFDETLNVSHQRRAKISRLADSNFTFLNEDLNSANLNEIVNEVNTVFHFAATPGLLPSWTNFRSYCDNNVMASFKLAEAIKSSGAQKNVVMASTSSVYGTNAIGDENAEIDPTSPYGITKFTSEQILKTVLAGTNNHLMILRLFSVYGPNQREDMAWQKIIRSIHTGALFPLTADKEHVRTCTYVGDIADLCNSLTSNKVKEGTFNICGNEEVNILKGINLIEKIMGKNLNFMVSETRRGDQIRTKGNSDLAKKLLGFNPKTTFEVGIKNQINSFVI
jgi:UDP-glucuronate 4-epimerase